MITTLARKIFGSANDRLISQYLKTVQKITALEPEISALDDAALRRKTYTFKEQLAAGRTLDDLLPEAYAVVREAAKRTMQLRAYDVQLIGAIALHQGKIAEMKTGEGKTLVATFAAYLNALTSKGVHVVTVNDYLARRDAGWMGTIYRFLGLSVGCIVHGMGDAERREAYHCDITYGTNNEYGFDYLRDNMKFSLEQLAMRAPHFAIVDEVDSILIDEARTPLIISGPAESSTELYAKVNAVVRHLSPDVYELDEKQNSVLFTEAGQEVLEDALRAAGLLADGGLYDVQNVSLVHHSQQAMRAHTLFKRDKDYIVKDGKVVIIDEFTGRMMEGRRYSDGLHQAIEAKEGVMIQMENQTLASITFQNYFRLYKKLAGMTGTAMTEAEEFEEIYGLHVVEIPTNVDVARRDEHDEIYRSAAEKNHAILEQIRQAHARKQPVLVGTVSIAKSEDLSAMLKKAKIPHQVLNARHHDQEAQIIAQAGKPGAVTIATNMAGRGTDIKLGGNLELMLQEAGADAGKIQDITARYEEDKQQVLHAGGLYVIGTERHESRRIDNQLRGRSGRQGDPGQSKFYICLEDDLMRIFGSERIDPLLRGLGLKENEPIIHPWLNKSIERAQRKVEARNFDIRKNLLKYDNVMNEQRMVIYDQRRMIMEADAVTDIIDEFRYELLTDCITRAMPPKSYPEEWNLAGLADDIKRIFNLDEPVEQWAKEEGVDDEDLTRRLRTLITTRAEQQREHHGEAIMQMVEKSLLLQILDQCWKEHLLELDHLKQGINLRAYAQRDPLNEYKKEAFDYFEAMLDRLREMVVSYLSRLEIHNAAQVHMPQQPNIPMRESRAQDPALAGAATNMDESASPIPQPRHTRHIDADAIDPHNPDTWGRVSRNALCPCGSGKKYKHCHGLA